METIDIWKTDFHSLRVLATVHETGSLSAAAARLDLNQSTVSYTVERLRAVFADALFVRLGRGMAPTERCTMIVAQAQGLIRDFHQLTRAEEFEPQKARARFVISCNFYERAVLMPELIKRVAREAPHLRLAFIQAHTNGRDQLVAGDCDLLLSPVPADITGLFTRRLVEERYSCFVAADGPYARGQLSLEAYARARHVHVNYEGGWKPFFRTALAELGVAIEPAIEMPSFGGIGALIAGTDLVLTAPSRLERVLAPHCIRLEAPFDCRFAIHMFWSARAHDSAMGKWLRNHVAAVARGAVAP
jgi:DNA-binding transcriptional LysR family regulator